MSAAAPHGADIELGYDKPVPVPDEHSAPFFEATTRGELLLQRCTACGRWMWPVRVRCIACFGPDLEWVPSAGRGTVYSFTLIHQVFHPGFAAEVPYNVAMIDLDEGVRCLSNVVGVPHDQVRIGQAVQVSFRRISADVALPQFRPVA